MNQIQPSKKVNYGLDAPNVIRNLAVAAFVVTLLALIFPVIKIGSETIDIRGLVWSGVSMGLGAVWMILYSVYGKYHLRDKMLALVNWTGAEQVLDIGTGKGLLLIGAAKRLQSGKATGIDIWNAEDLTGNHIENALQNARLEGVANKIDILNENAIKMSFADETFDVILSNECLHNIYNKNERQQACKEIVRVLKPGGCAIISDHKLTAEYQKYFEEAGLQVKMINKYYITAYPTLRILDVRKT